MSTYRNLQPELDTDPEGNDRETAPGNTWTAYGRTEGMIDLVCDRTGAWVRVTDEELASDWKELLTQQDMERAGLFKEGAADLTPNRESYAMFRKAFAESIEMHTRDVQIIEQLLEAAPEARVHGRSLGSEEQEFYLIDRALTMLQSDIEHSIEQLRDGIAECDRVLGGGASADDLQAQA